MLFYMSTVTNMATVHTLQDVLVGLLVEIVCCWILYIILNLQLCLTSLYILKHSKDRRQYFLQLTNVLHLRRCSWRSGVSRAHIMGPFVSVCRGFPRMLATLTTLETTSLLEHVAQQWRRITCLEQWSEGVVTYCCLTISSGDVSAKATQDAALRTFEISM
jgi:hypothetical protein